MSTGHERELGLVRWIGRAGAAEAAQAALVDPEGLDGAQAVLSRARAVGLLRRVDRPFPNHPPIHLATAAGLRAAGLAHLRPAQARPPGLAHTLGCGWLGLELEAEHATAAVHYERELRAGSAAWALPELGAGPGNSESHRPDLALEIGGRRFAVELELSRKAPVRLGAILRGYAAAPGLDGVRYYTPDKGLGARVIAASRRVGAEGLVEVVAWAPPERRSA